jgi:hypothetical protein
MEDEAVKRAREFERAMLAKAVENQESVASLMAKLLGEGWLAEFDERERRLIDNCRTYAANDPAGMPGHGLALIIARMADLLDELEGGPDVKNQP